MSTHLKEKPAGISAKVSSDSTAGLNLVVSGQKSWGKFLCTHGGITGCGAKIIYCTLSKK